MGTQQLDIRQFSELTSYKIKIKAWFLRSTVPVLCQMQHFFFPRLSYIGRVETLASNYITKKERKKKVQGQ